MYFRPTRKCWQQDLRVPPVDNLGELRTIQQWIHLAKQEMRSAQVQNPPPFMWRAPVEKVSNGGVFSLAKTVRSRVVHLVLSTVEMTSLYLSQGKLPDLRGENTETRK